MFLKWKAIHLRMHFRNIYICKTTYLLLIKKKTSYKLFVLYDPHFVTVCIKF